MDTHARSAVAAAAFALCVAMPMVSKAQAFPPISAATAATDVRVSAPLKLDAKRLLSMKAGEQIAIDFPEIGRQTVTFETLTRGLDQRVYWHGRLGQNPRDRVFLKQTPTGFVGAVRLAGRQVAFEQQAQQPLRQADASVLAVAGQAYALGESLGRGEVALRSNLAALTQAQPGSEVALPLPGGITEVAILTHVGVDEHGFQHIAGISRMDGAAYPVQLTISPDAVFGSLITPRGDYQVLTRAGRTHVLDPRAAGVVAPQGDDQMAVPDDAAQPIVPVTQAILRRTSGSGGSTPAVESGSTPLAQQLLPLPPNTVDTVLNVLVTYSGSFVASWGSELAARTRIASLVALANTAHGNSGTGVQYRIVGWRQVNVPDDTPQAQLDRLRLDTGGFEGTAIQKAQQGAAMTVFFAPLNEVTVATNTCGIAYVPGAFAAGLSAYRQQVSALTFSALNDGQWNTQYCESLSLAHELGHLLGAVHDKDNAPFKGVFSYSFGKGVAGVFGTVMSYIQPRVAMFSSPQLSCSADGQPCGSSTENVVATMRQTKPYLYLLGVADANVASPETGLSVTGWMLQADGTPYVGAARLQASDARVQCQTGRTGYYRCSVPKGVHSVTLRAWVSGKTVTPGVATFSVPQTSSSLTSTTQGRFYVR